MVKKVSVIIPAYNEEKNIEKVIEISKKYKNTDQIIVVNNNSIDNTVEIAKKAGAEVINCTEQGKGNAMRKGLENAKNELIVFLDADILNYRDDIVEILVNPIIKKEAKFVKSTWKRETGGNVTRIAIQPLLKILYPDLYKFSEPLSGMIASEKNILEQIQFEPDYGVDIGIVIDIYQKKIKIKEVDIGEVINTSHNTKDIKIMQEMSYEVMKAIIKRSKGKIQ